MNARNWRRKSDAAGKAGFVLTAALCALPETTLKDGKEYIRRDHVMDLIARWRREIDAIPPVTHELEGST